MTDFLRPGKALVQPGNADEPYSSPAPTPARSEVRRSAVNAERLRLIAIELEKFADQGGRGHPDMLRRDADYLRLLAREYDK